MNTHPLIRAAVLAATAALAAGVALVVVETTSDAAPAPRAAHTVQVVEGAEATVTVTLRKPVKHRTKLVWRTRNGTARAGADYAAVHRGRVVLHRGARSATVRVATLDDSTVEGTEHFFVTFEGTKKAVRLKSPRVEVVIIDNDAATVTPSAAPTGLPTSGPIGAPSGLTESAAPSPGV